ncbi:ComEA family DNA-binding protein [Desulfurivibrio sp. C05AmB]|jgi:competence protein ComEA|uniref:ComEA family DNA-binding protein n=1 Tax=Desulfurivibrio sp. C05AmB TaxID=3374371 RepID=UPI00376ED6CE
MLLKKIVLILTLLLFMVGTALAAALNINTASREQLMGLDGVNHIMASAIVTYRESTGPFASVDDLAKVPGIDARTVERLRDRITVAD